MEHKGKNMRIKIIGLLKILKQKPEQADSPLMAGKYVLLSESYG